jgi:hypothetical protein
LIPAVSPVVWKPCYRLVPSRFPPVGVYDRVAHPADLDAVFAVENMTNPRLRQEAGDISLVALEDRVSGPGTTPIMAAFTHLDPEGSRFTDGTYGVYYAASSLDTAIIESKHARERFLRRTREEAVEVDMRTYLADLDSELHDIRGDARFAAVYELGNYAPGQKLGRELKRINSGGIAYDSVRQSGGECVAVFRPRLLSNCIQAQHFCFVWDGASVVQVYEKRSYPDQ